MKAICNLFFENLFISSLPNSFLLKTEFISFEENV